MANITITKNNGAVVFDFSGSQHYMYNGTAEWPLNSLAMFIDESNMVTFKNAAGDIVYSLLLSDLGKTKAQMEEDYPDLFIGDTGGGGGGGDYMPLYPTRIFPTSATPVNFNEITEAGQYFLADVGENHLNAPIGDGEWMADGILVVEGNQLNTHLVQTYYETTDNGYAPGSLLNAYWRVYGYQANTSVMGWSPWQQIDKANYVRVSSFLPNGQGTGYDIDAAGNVLVTPGHYWIQTYYQNDFRHRNFPYESYSVMPNGWLDVYTYGNNIMQVYTFSVTTEDVNWGIDPSLNGKRFWRVFNNDDWTNSGWKEIATPEQIESVSTDLENANRVAAAALNDLDGKISDIEERMNGLTFVALTQEEYDYLEAEGLISETTIYFIKNNQ